MGLPSWRLFPIIIGLTTASVAEAQWTNTGGGDHGGADWTPANGAAIAGVHTNIGKFTVAAGTTITVQPFDGTNFGSLEVRANGAIQIDGTLNGDAAGYLGGAGGAAGANQTCTCTGTPAGAGGGGGVGDGPAGSGGSKGAVGQVKCPVASSGGGGGGSHGGAGGAGGTGRGSPKDEHCTGTSPTNTAPGGAGRALYGNNTDELVDMGAGGGGGGGAHGRFGCGGAGGHSVPNNCGRTDPAGGAGQAGGARIALVALGGAVTVSSTGIVSASGGGGGAGGSSDGPASTTDCVRSGAGGGGGAAGGGILIKANTVTNDGTVRANGGAGGLGGDSGDNGASFQHIGGDGGQGGGAGRIKIVSVTSGGAGVLQLNGGAGGAGGCGGAAAGFAGAAGGGNTAAALTCSDCVATRLVFINAAQTITAGDCTAALAIQSQNVNGAATAPNAATTITLSSSQGTGSFWSDSACTTMPLSAVTIGSNAINSGIFHYKDTKAPSATIAATPASGMTGLTPTSQLVTINPGPAAAVMVAGFPSPSTAGVAGTFTVTAQDANGNTAPDYKGTVSFTGSDPPGHPPRELHLRHCR